jgi:predicted metallopeptidase
MNHQILIDFAVVVAGTCLYIVVTRLFSMNSTTSKVNLYNRGYVHAASTLLRNESTPDSLLELAHNPFHQNEFDEGIKQAVHDFIHYRDIS